MLSITINDATGHARLAINHEGTVAEVALTVDEGLSARCRLDFWDADLREFAGLFAEMAESWKGWDGSKRWALGDERFSLEAEHDGLGHIIVSAGLTPTSDGLHWTAQLVLRFEAGNLAEVSKYITDRVYG